jgi:hypothetical protein
MKKIALIVALAFATPALADPFVSCLSGCPQKGMKLKADTQIKDAWWLGPSLGLALQAYDTGTHTWSTQVAFQFAYGIKWRPTWSPMPTFLSLDLGLSAGTTPTNPNFEVTVAPTLTLLDVVAIGYGPRFKFNEAGSTINGVFFLGLSTSFGGI